MWSNDGEPAEVHHGFMADFEAINVEVVKHVSRLRAAARPNADIYITGHSLGGAVAILCAMDFVRQKLPVAGVFTFGQPRLGNTVFAGLYDEMLIAEAGMYYGRTLRDITFRIVNQNDIVPRVPAWLGYRHCGTEIFLEPNGGWSVDPCLGYKMLCDLLGLYGAFRCHQEVLIKNHFIAAYIERIEKL